MLETIKSPNDIKSLSLSQMQDLATEIRSTIVNTVARNGGHLASNLGMVEATLVLHKLFNSPEDKIIFDIGHQCYAHKILTGRYDKISTIRQYGGISGFSSKKESPHDILCEGHCGTSISSALGIAEANRIQNKDDYTIAIIGDGSLTNGLVYEALNNCSQKDLNLIILVNDNEMSISKNVGGLHTYLSTIRTSKKYFCFKHGVEYILEKIPFIGHFLAVGCKKIKDLFKRIFASENLFEDLGLIYLGPVDGNNIQKLTNVLIEAKAKHSCCVVHMTTKKGLGYALAEKNPELYHSVAPFNVEIGATAVKSYSFSEKIGDLICEKAKTDDRICAITAAMCDGTGLSRFSKEYPSRFFDVGIAESHSVTFAGGLAVNGLKPVLFLYSTFAQRSYDQIFHDISIQQLPLVLALDHSGLVENDGITHQGIFDYALLSSLPNTFIYSPENYAELSLSLDMGISGRGLSVIRYPKGCEITGYETETKFEKDESGLFTYTEGADRANIVIITCGRLTYQAYRASELLCDDYSVGILKLIRVFPLDCMTIKRFTQNAKLVYILDENQKSGSMAEKISSIISLERKRPQVLINAVDGYVDHGSLDDLYRQYGFFADQIADEIKNSIEEFGNV